MGKVKNIDKNRNKAEIKSIKLKTSPPSRKRLFKNNKTPQKIKKATGGTMPKTSIKNTNAEAKSITPKIRTKTLFAAMILLDNNN
ncbi:hypothetical protein HYW75_04190 [Candidatus Pacearchaeota archaeon]|nr:hypothetical protein [Candidatus Pacearchaeota archaeon]